MAHKKISHGNKANFMKWFLWFKTPTQSINSNLVEKKKRTKKKKIIKSTRLMRRQSQQQSTELTKSKLIFR